MADIKFSQFTNTPTPNANAFFVGYNGVTGINSRTTLTDLIAAIGAPSGSGTTNFISKWSGTNTLTDSLFYSDANVAKTIYGGNDKGLFIDFVNSITSLANNQGFGLIANPWDLYLGDFNDLQYSTTLQILDANRVIKTRDYVGDRGFYLDFENYLFSFGTQQKGFNVNLTNLKYTLGDFGSSNNSTTFQVDDLNQVIKTSNGGIDQGIILDFTNNVYLFGNADNVPNQLYIAVNELILGDAFNNVNSTKFIVDDSVQIIKTSSQGTDKGLFLNFVSDELALWDINQLGLYIQSPYASFGKPTFGYEFRVDNNNCNIGDYQYEANGTILSVDASINQIIKTRNQGADRGLYIDYSNNLYVLGGSESGDMFGDFVRGIKITNDNTTVGDAWDYVVYLDIDHLNSRINLNSNRTKYKNLTTTQINALTGNQKGDVVFNSTLNKLCFYDGTSWQQVTSIPM